MAIVVKKPRQVAQEFLDHLKSLRPEVNTDQTDSDWWIRSRVIGGVIAGLYADLNRVSNDCFPQSARREAINKHLEVYFGSGLRTATYAVGNVAVSGTDGATGTIIPANTEFEHDSTGYIYACTASTMIIAASGTDIPVQSRLAGTNQNIVSGSELSFVSPITGVVDTATVVSPGITDGRDEETTSAGAERVLAKIRNPVRGGTEADYQNWAIAADSRVISCRVNRHAYGLGSVQLVISAGTADFDDAIDNDETIIVQPSADLKATVLEYVDGYNPITDVVYVDGPTEKAIDVSVVVAFTSGDCNTIIADAGVSQGTLVDREIRRAIYNTPIGGREIGSVSAIRAADIEEQIDYNLSSEPLGVGLKFQIVGDRQVTITGGTPNLVLLPDEVAIPGTITVADM